MVDWSNAVIAAVAGLVNVFVVLSLLMLAVWGVGALLRRMPGEKGEGKT